MPARTYDEFPLSRAQSALRYLIAALPMLFIGSIHLWILTDGFGTTVVPPAEETGVLGHLGLTVVDAVGSLVAIGLLPWRRRHPYAVAIATTLLGAVSPMASGSAGVAYVSLVTHRQWGRIAVVVVLTLLAQYGYTFVVPDASTSSQLFGATTTLAVLMITTVLGLYLASQRDLQRSHLERITADQQEREERARLGERERIAREMHDVLAHRLSLLSLHAAALAHRTNLTPEEVRSAAAVIQESAHQSLDELRGALGVLRTKPAAEAPQPSWGDVPALVEEVRAAGQHVTVTDAVHDAAALPERIGRHAYRVVQESLTNARKHAPRSAVELELSGSPGAALRVRVVNALDPFATGAPGAGAGLVGLGERAHLLEGTLTHRADGGRFVVEASLPWPAPAPELQEVP